MAFINGKNIPFVYHTVPVPSTVRVETGSFTAEGGETSFSKRDLGFKPDIVIFYLYDAPTAPASTDTAYAINDKVTDTRVNITNDWTLGTSTNTKPIRIYRDGFVAYPSNLSEATFLAGNTYMWIAIKGEG